MEVSKRLSKQSDEALNTDNSAKPDVAGKKAEQKQELIRDREQSNFSGVSTPSESGEQKRPRAIPPMPPTPGQLREINSKPKMSKEEADAAFNRRYPPDVQEAILAEMRWKYGIIATKLERRTE